ncbi:MAG: YdcH family protein [Albidovulum sp.]
MSHTPHELLEEFPQHHDDIHRLKLENGHFSRLAGEYHDINRQIHRAETNIEPVEQLAEVDLRKQRAALKDEIAAMLAKA